MDCVLWLEIYCISNRMMNVDSNQLIITPYKLVLACHISNSDVYCILKENVSSSVDGSLCHTCQHKL